MTSYQTVMANIRAKAVECGRSADEITVIAVSKNYHLPTMQSAYQEGARDFGESRMQEALTKIPLDASRLPLAPHRHVAEQQGHKGCGCVPFDSLCRYVGAGPKDFRGE